MTTRGVILAAAIALVAGAAFAAPFEDAEAALQRGDYAAAIEILRPLAAAGNTAAQANLGVLYQFGRGVSQDFDEAIKWYRLAADKGFGRAQNNLGIMYQNGSGVAQNYPEAVKWYRRAADLDYVEA
jgi:TPR repeat protein